MKYGEIVPQNLQDELAMISAQETLNSWRIGEIANSLFVMASQAGEKVTMQNVCAAVGYFCGRSVSSVIQCARLEKQFPPEIREVYDGLPLSHFEVASHHKDPIKVLDYSRDNYPISAAKVEEAFREGEKENALVRDLLNLSLRVMPYLDDQVKARFQQLIIDLIDIVRLVDTKAESV